MKCSFFVTLTLTFVNFCDSIYQNATTKINTHINESLDGYVLYYALYSAEDKHCAVLYDYRSIISKLYLVIYKMILQIMFQQDLSAKSVIFTYETVMDNVDNLSQFFIDCVIVSYVKNGVIHNELHTHETNPTDTCHDASTFVYAIVDDGLKHHDFTKAFNLYSKGITSSKTLTCLDVIKLMSIITKTDVNLSEFTLKCMTDKTFTESVFKENDIISSKLNT